MSELERNARYTDERIAEHPAQLEVRTHALEEGMRPISPTTGAHLAFIATSTGARSIIEIGSGVGVASLWLHRGAPNATLTAIDDGPEHLAQARRALLAEGARSSTLRLIAGHPLDLLPRMTESGYDLVVIGGELEHIAAYLQHALRLVRPGGTIVALRALNGGRVADPARRDPVTSGLRALIREFDRQPDLTVSILPVDGGILQLAKRAS
ncbi:O-methyltransferase [Pseudoclavibacter endophyticus]|uniref:Methyltransferase domain-containing protein n=1 Tax=Pseudoclavibacter endophyticus TaxID=1778590 RepID=A0A6H9WS64_9MICO|nr:methyltransferase [Pseudoclavibacter endophyticus]KAB1649767.1 methyltransferase domain-containing protein [Pseudoclavibacter endophyticus]GGA59891.1 O-methyltransferase [Pseudoclavibacter endophyticus]